MVIDIHEIESETLVIANEYERRWYERDAPLVNMSQMKMKQ